MISSKRTFLLGLLLASVLAILGYYTLFLTEFSWFKETRYLTVEVADAGGLRRGDSVLVAGVRWGRIDTVTYDPQAPLERRVVVRASLESPLALHDGYRIVISDATVLGGHVLSIDPGPHDAPLVAVDGALPAVLEPGALTALRRMVEDNRESVTGTLQDVRAIVADLRAGKGALGRVLSDEEVASDLEVLVRGAGRTAENLAEITGDLRSGRGVLGKLLSDDALYGDLQATLDKLSTALDETAATVRAVREGDGLVGRLVSDPALGEDVASTLADLRAVASRLEQGQGTLGRLLGDDEIAANVESLTRALAEGRGTIGRLVNDPGIYDDLDALASNLAVITSAMREGRGTLGRLVMDDELYEELKRAMGFVSRTLEEFREAAPVTTFTSVLFGAF